MINQISQAIIDKLAELYPDGFRRYSDNVTQNFTTPCFSIVVIEQEYNKRLNKKYSSAISFDVAYFSDVGTADIVSDCLEKQEVLLRGLDDIGSVRAINKNARITDDVLHITFDIRYSELKTESETPIQAKKVNLKL